MNINAFVKVLESAECKEIEGLRCFIVRWDQFHELMEQIDVLPRTSDMLTRRHEYENFEIKLSSIEKGTYFICAKSEPILDALWEQKEK
jgi:hypothetical protein